MSAAEAEKNELVEEIAEEYEKELVKIEFAEVDKTKTKKRVIVFAAAAIVLLFFHFVCPVPTGLERPAISAAGLLFAIVIIWVGEAMPFIVSCVGIMALLPLLGIIPVKDVYGAAVTPVVWFCFCSFACSAAAMMTPIPYRFAHAALKFAGNNPKKLLIAFSVACSFLSMFVSDLAACAIFVGLSLAIVQASGAKKGDSRLAKALLLTVASAAALGGIGTPTGNSLNILCMSMVEQTMGVRVTYASWCAIGVPMALISSILSAIWFGFVFKLDPIPQQAIDAVAAQVGNFGGISKKEIKFLVWFLSLFVVWFSTTWITSINMMHVGLIWTVIAFIPGIDVLEHKYYYSRIGWDVIWLIAGVQALSTALVKTGIITWFVNTVFAGAEAWPMLLVVAFMILVTMVLHVMIPTGPPCVSVAMPFMMALGMKTGVNGGLIAMLGGFFGGVTTIIPIDAIMMIAFCEGWMTMGDWVKKGWGATVILGLLSLALLPIFAPLLYH